MDEKGEKVELIEKEVLIDLQQEREVNFEFDDSYKKTIKSVRIRGWVRINDGFYGFTQLVPYENAPTFLGNKGLTVNVEVEFEEDGKLFGLLRMPDFLWWFYHSDQAMGALMMSFTIGRDIGLVISKGVFFSLVCVFTVMPSLILWFDELVDKLDKGNLKKRFKKNKV